jgi:hypothetical protein
MSDVTESTRSVVIERKMPHPPEKIWRALTQPWLIEEWLMKNDFSAEVGHRFTFRAMPLPGWSGAAPARLSLGRRDGIGQRPHHARHLDADRAKRRHVGAHGTVRLPPAGRRRS